MSRPDFVSPDFVSPDFVSPGFLSPGFLSLCDAFQRTAAARAADVALRTPGGAVEITWGEYAVRVRRIAAGLAALGVGRGDTVGLMMVNRPEFHLCDTAAMHLGAAAFSIYNTSSVDQIAHVLGNAGNRVMFSEAQFVDRLLAAGGAVEHIVCVDGAPEGTLPLAELEGIGDPGFAFDAAWRAVTPDDLLTLIYTSGTTGPSKGVELTHANMLDQVRAAAEFMSADAGDRIVSFLPAAHVADRMLSHYCPMAFGIQVTSIAALPALFAALPEVRPTLWGAVPRVWEKLKAALEAGFAREPDEQRRAGIAWALDVGLRRVHAEQAAIAGTGPGPDDALLAESAKADAMVWSAVRAKLGLDRVRWSAAGAAATPTGVLEFFGAIGLPICELWGMSELSCVGTINPPVRAKLGTVGRAVRGLELRLADDGELLCRGGGVMRGYRGEPDRTADAIDPDGWLHTGDVAEIDDEGYVRIVDRKKELIINAAGKNMSPANIEAAITASSALIGQAVAVGDGRPYNVALIVLDPDACAAYAAQRGLPDASAAALCDDSDIRATVASAVDRANGQLSRVEQIKAFTILGVDWLPAGDELTPTMKLRRRPISEKYRAEIEALYTRGRAATEVGS